MEDDMELDELVEKLMLSFEADVDWSSVKLKAQELVDYLEELGF